MPFTSSVGLQVLTVVSDVTHFSAETLKEPKRKMSPRCSSDTLSLHQDEPWTEAGHKFNEVVKSSRFETWGTGNEQCDWYKLLDSETNVFFFDYYLLPDETL